MHTFEALKTALLELHPSGSKSFEELIATVLEYWINFPVRIARSGLQNGRDGGTGPGPFTLLFEAKRYGTTNVSLRELHGELAVALQDYPTLDIYVIAATSPISDEFRRSLAQHANEKGAEVLALDWPASALPPLAAFLAAEADKCLKWFQASAPNIIDAEALRTLFRGVTAHEAFPASYENLGRQLSAATLGWGGLRETCERTLRAHFSDRKTARRTFGQFLAPADPAAGSILRVRVSGRVDTWWRNNKVRSPVLVVQGDEGVGKTWTIPQWWRELLDKGHNATEDSEAPILIIVPAHLSRSIGEVDAARFIAGAIAHQVSGTLENGLMETWRRKLQRWSAYTTAEIQEDRLLIVLDGLNEATGVAWARLIERLTSFLPSIGGKLAVTTRTAFWRTEVVDRLFQVPIETLTVEGFDETELSEAARQCGLRLEEIDRRVREFIRTPRIFYIAADFIADIAPHEITTDRLLLEYWKRRLQERGDLLAHSDDDFQRIVISHARSLKQGMTSFEVDDWKSHSSRSRRGFAGSLDDDLTEVVEGRFFLRDESELGSYHVRGDCLPFVIGLLLCEELRKASLDDMIAIIDRAFDPISGLDRTSDILLSAFGIATLDERNTDKVCVAIAARWLSEQNRDNSQGAFNAFAAYVSKRPTVYLDLLEVAYADSCFTSKDWIIEALQLSLKRPPVKALIAPRLKEWMGLWSFDNPIFQPRHFPDHDASAQVEGQRQRHREAVQRAYEELDDSDRALMDRLCRRVENPRLPQIAEVVPRLIFGQPLADFSEGLLAWMLAGEIGSRSISDTGISWLYLFSEIDLAATSVGLLELAGKLLDTSTATAIRNAAARLFALEGSRDSEKRAADIFQRPGCFVTWRRVEQLCDSDPIDPESHSPTNISRASQLSASINPHEINLHMCVGLDDHNLRMITPGLARFRPEPIIDLWRMVVETAASREPFAINRLCFSLPSVSPLLKDCHVTALLNLLREIGDQVEHPLRSRDCLATPTYLAKAVFPHLSGNAQLDALTSPQGEMFWDARIVSIFKAADPTYFEKILNEAIASGCEPKITSSIFFACTGDQELTERTKSLIIELYNHENPYVRSLSFDIAWKTGDSILLERLFGYFEEIRALPSDMLESFSCSRAIVRAAATSKQTVPFAKLTPDIWEYAVSINDSVASREEWAIATEIVCGFLFQGAIMPNCHFVFERMQAQRNSEASFSYFDWSRDNDQEDLLELLFCKGIEDENNISKHVNKTAEMRYNELNDFIQSLERYGLQNIADVPSIAAFENLAEVAPERLLRIGDRLLTCDRHCLPRVVNIGLVAVPGLSRINAGLAKRVFDRLHLERPMVSVLIGPEKTPLEMDVAFAATDGPTEIDDLREALFLSARNDRTLAALVLAAERRLKLNWMHEFAHRMIKSSYPARVALGLTVMGFCSQGADDALETIAPFEQGLGSLATAAEAAKKAWRRNQWARVWHDKAQGAQSGEELWSYGELMIKAADYRYVTWYAPANAGSGDKSPWARFSHLFARRLRERGENRADKRAKSLFGSTPPPPEWLG
jgi:hypothetical protein